MVAQLLALIDHRPARRRARRDRGPARRAVEAGVLTLGWPDRAPLARRPLKSPDRPAGV
jgi:hypothetical protein